MRIMALMTIREYGRLRGVTHHAVRKAIDTGKLKTSLVASERGKRKTYLIDSDAADAEWPKGDQELMKNAPLDSSLDADDKDMQIDPLDPEKKKQAESYQSSRALRESYQARLAQLEFEKESEQLIEVEDVQRAWIQAAGQVRTKLLALPAKMKQRFPSFSDEQRIALDEIIRETLEELADQKGEIDG
jgi:phage terminase Nu1 subunit (DNA packaging protein)